MRNCEHPAYQPTERKLRRFAGILSNFTELLRDDGFDHDEASRWWMGEHEKLESLGAAARNDPARAADFRAEEQRVEAELFKRMDQLVKFVYAHAPDHPFLPPYRLYMALWDRCYGEPVRPLSPQDLLPPQEPPEPIVAPTIYGVPFERLDATRLRLSELDLPHKDLGALVMFLCGLSYAAGYLQRHHQPPKHCFDDGLREAAREALEEAVDFSNLPRIVAQAKHSERTGTPETVGRLVMAICHAQRNHTPAVYEWLCRKDLTRDLTSLLFAMGVRAFSSPYAKGLVGQWRAEPSSAASLLPIECAGLIARFGEEE